MTRWHDDYSKAKGGSDQNGRLAHRVVNRYREALQTIPKQAADWQPDLWLPDLLGAKKRLSDEAIKAIKAEMKADTSPYGKKDGKAPAGGIVYFLFKAIHEASLAQKLWNLLDQNAGLAGDSQWEDLAGRIAGHLSHDPAERKVQAAGLCVDLLMRTRQGRKATSLNRLLTREFANEIAAVNAAGPPGPAERLREPAQKKRSPAQVLIAWAEDPGVKAVVQKALQATGKDPAKVARLIVDTLEDANVHRGASIAEGLLGPMGQVDTAEMAYTGSDAASALDWGVESVCGFAVGLLMAIGASASATRLAKALVGEYPDIFEDRLL